MAKTVVHYTPAQNVTVKASGDISGGTFVEIAGDADGRNPVVKTAAAGSTPYGVPAHDCPDGEYVTAHRSGHQLEVASTGSIAAGDLVAVGASGKAVKQAEAASAVGLAISASANGFVQIALH